MFASAIRNSGILSGGIWNPGFWNPKLQLKETGIQVPLTKKPISRIRDCLEANKYRVLLKSYSDAGKKSNWDKEWDKENV